MSAESDLTSPLRVMNEVLAFEISNPSTSAEIVPTTAMEDVTKLLVSSFRCRSGNARLAIMPAKAPAKITANMMMPTIIGESVIILFPEWLELHPDNVHLQSQEESARRDWEVCRSVLGNRSALSAALWARVHPAGRL